ncbi:hypothetical protein L1887_60195 [Cichorium endivia]|nr:hypothetical protein L1887_60195 [Cichorium endivia]
MGSTDTLVGALVAKRFPAIWHRLPLARSAHAYKPVATDTEPRTPSLDGRRLRVVGVLLLAAFLLGVGGQQAAQGLGRKARNARRSVPGLAARRRFLAGQGRGHAHLSETFASDKARGDLAVWTAPLRCRPSASSCASIVGSQSQAARRDTGTAHLV